jgi:hypothetical protein
MNTTDMAQAQVRQTLPQTVEEFPHPYGGRARAVSLTKTQFARFFGVSEYYVTEWVEPNVKFFDLFTDDRYEILGYKVRVGTHPEIYLVVIIDHDK